MFEKKREICLRKLKTNRFLRQKAFKILWVLIYHVQNYLQRKINKLNQFFGIGKPPTQSLSPNKIHCVIWLEKILRISLSLHATRYKYNNYSPKWRWIVLASRTALFTCLVYTRIYTYMIKIYDFLGRLLLNSERHFPGNKRERLNG